MNLFNALKKKLFETAPGEKASTAERGIMLFEETGEVLRAERLLRQACVNVSIKAPPPRLRAGCDMVIEYPLAAEPAIRTLMQAAKISILQYHPVSGELTEPTALFWLKDFGQYLMVRAANMKVTIDRNSRRIVNVSGGGCPDVPYLASQIIGEKLELLVPEHSEVVQGEKADPPFSHSHITLCGYALQLALREAARLLSGKKAGSGAGHEQGDAP
jgi:hypothetical protein